MSYKSATRKKTVKANPTRWEMVYGTIAMKINRRRRIDRRCVLSVAKFLAVPVFLFSYPYSWISMMFTVRKVAKIKTRQSQ